MNVVVEVCQEQKQNTCYIRWVVIAQGYWQAHFSVRELSTSSHSTPALRSRFCHLFYMPPH